jgi:Na+-driven multidrug efflux pump/anti-sigma regulatory factor (Ser/Thr protein kinase)
MNTAKDNDAKFIRRLYRRCLVSSMAAILGSVLGQIFNAAIIGRTLGPQELSVIGITLPVYYVYATAGALLGVGGTAVCARLIGKDRSGESRLAFTCVYMTALAASAVITAVMLIFTRQIMALLGVTPDMPVYESARQYMRALSIGGVGIMSIYPAFNLLRLDGRNTATAAVFFVMAGVNIAMSAFFLLVLKTGAAGAAVSTVCGSSAAGLLGAALLFTGSKNFRFQFGRGFFRLALDIFLAGSPSALENLCILIRTMFLNRLLASVAGAGGMLALSAFKVTDSVNSFALVFIAGVSGSIIPFIGVFATEKDTGSIRQLLKLSFKWGGLMILGFTGVCLAFARPIAIFFGMSGAESLPAAVSAIRIFALSLPLALANSVLVCLYQANQKTAAANALTAGRSLVWALWAAYMLFASMGPVGIWHSFWLAELISLGLAALHAAVCRSKNKNLSPLLLLDTEAEENGTYRCFAVGNNVDSITDASAGITEFCETNGLGRKRTMAIRLAIEEMLVSIHTHSCASDAGLTMNVRLLIWEDIVVMRIRNSGKPFNPIEYYERNRQRQKAGMGALEGLDALSDSLGIKMILDLANSVDYRSTFGVNNITIII